MRFCLNMIVKDEAARIERMLNSMKPYIDGACIADTGSTDDTKKVITQFFLDAKLPLQIVDVEFKDWAYARNSALDYGREFAKHHNLDYLWLVDADMELKMVREDVFRVLPLGGDSYDVYQHAGSLHYQNRRLVKATTTGHYLGVTHEFLNIDTSGFLPEDMCYFLDHADGSNRTDKFKRDIRLLKQGIKDEPKNERYFYYLAQSYRDAGKPERAIEWYQRRIDAGGWPEEVWSAYYNMAHCYKDIRDEPKFISGLLDAYNYRPSRAEPLHDLANYYRHKGWNAPACMLAEQSMSIPKSHDALFVNDYVYDVGCASEFAITAFYANRKEKGFEVADHLSLKAGPYGDARELARFNLYWYLPALKDVCPSFVAREIPFKAPEGWAALNPSITMIQRNGRAHCQAVIRTVNYTMDDMGRYLIRDTNGEANDSNPINTRNYIAWLGEDPLDENEPEINEIRNPDMPVEFAPVIGFEDMRLFFYQGETWSSSTVRQLCVDGLPEQVLARVIQRFGQRPIISEYKRMLREPRECQKNWSPMIKEPNINFMYRPGEVVDFSGKTIFKHPTEQTTDHISGGSQLISYDHGWLSVVHEARQQPNSPKRYYYHRFAFYTNDGRLEKLSRPFVFHDKQIEFCAGMCWHPDGQHLILSYGVRDSEAWLGQLSRQDVDKFLWFRSK